MTSLFARLRDETAPQHRALEDQLNLMSPSLTRDRYIDILQGFFGYVAPYEQRLLAAAPAHLQAFIEPRLRTSLLRRDLLALGQVPRPARCGRLPAMGTPASLFGCMYVLEGSTLGGRVIAPHIERRCAVQAGVGNAYFIGHGPRTGEMWTAFRRTADSELAEPDHDEAVAAAVATFVALGDWFSSPKQAAA